MVVIDVYETPTVKAADHAYLIRPGTDGALATALMHIMFRDGYADRVYMAEFSDVPDELEVVATTESGGEGSVVMGVEHKSLPIAAVQFHPESILTNPRHGLRMLANCLRRLSYD